MGGGLAADHERDQPQRGGPLVEHRDAEQHREKGEHEEHSDTRQQAVGTDVTEHTESEREQPDDHRAAPEQGGVDPVLHGPKSLTRVAMAMIMEDGSVLPGVAYLTSAQLGRPFPVRWVEVPERDGQAMPVRIQFAEGQVTRGKKFEGVWGTDEGAYVVNSFAFNSADLPADAAKHDGMVSFYSYARRPSPWSRTSRTSRPPRTTTRLRGTATGHHAGHHRAMGDLPGLTIAAQAVRRTSCSSACFSHATDGRVTLRAWTSR